MALADNLVSYWKLDESSGTAADALSANTLANGNTATYVAGKINNGVNLNGSDQYLYKDSDFGIAWGTSYSFGGWVKLNSEIGTGAFVLFALGHSTQAVSVIRYEYNSGTRRLKFVRYNGSVDTEPAYNVTLGTSNYAHIMCTYDSSGATRMDLYVNGTSVVNTTSSNGAGSGSSYTQGFRIGKYNDATSATTNAILDEAAVWSRCLSSTEVSALYKSGAGWQYPFATAYTMAAAYATFALAYQTITTRRNYAVQMAAGLFSLVYQTVSWIWDPYMDNTSKPTASIVNSSKVSFGETWETIDSTWASETRTWLAVSQLLSNTSRASSSITNQNKP